METIAWIIVNLGIIGSFIFLVRWLSKPSRDEVEAKVRHEQTMNELYYRDFKFTHYPPDGVNGLSEPELVATMQRTFQGAKTKVLQVYLTQYGDLIRRIESGDPQTVNTLGEDGIDFHLELAKANYQFVQDELRRRGENPF